MTCLMPDCPNVPGEFCSGFCRKHHQWMSIRTEPTCGVPNQIATIISTGRIDARHGRSRRLDLGDQTPFGVLYHLGYEWDATHPDNGQTGTAWYAAHYRQGRPG